jgi:FAS-associated factor 2
MDGMSTDGLPTPSVVHPDDYNNAMDDDLGMQLTGDGDNTFPAYGGGVFNMDNTYNPSTSDIQKLSAFLDKCSVDYDFWVQTWEHKYGGTHPQFVCDNFTDALATAKDLLRPIVINLQSPAIGCIDFNSLVLTSAPLAQVLSENFIFWAGFVNDTHKTEAQRSLAMALRTHPSIQENAAKFGEQLLEFPVTLVIGHIDSSPTVLEVMQGMVPADEIIAKLYSVMDTIAASQEKTRQQRARSQQQRSLIEEQDSAYKESLRRDAEKARVKEETERAAKEASDKKMNTLSSARRAALAKMDNVAPEPAAGSPAGTVAIRLPDGSKIQRKFDPSRPLMDVFDFVEATIAQRLQDDTYLDDTTAFDSADPKPWSIKSYGLLMNFPKKTLMFEDGQKTLKELGLAPGQSLLHLQDIRSL